MGKGVEVHVVPYTPCVAQDKDPDRNGFDPFSVDETYPALYLFFFFFSLCLLDSPNLT